MPSNAALHMDSNTGVLYIYDDIATTWREVQALSSKVNFFVGNNIYLEASGQIIWDAPGDNTLIYGSNIGSFIIAQVQAIENWRATPSEFVINENSVDLDFRVESNINTHALFVQGSDGNVGMGRIPTSQLDVFDSTGNSAAELTLATATGGSDTKGGVISFERGLRQDAQIYYDASTGGLVIESTATGVFVSLWAGSAERAKITSSEFVINEASNDYDFRVESNTNTHALFVQGSDGNVGIGANNPGQKLTLFNTVDDIRIQFAAHSAYGSGYVSFHSDGVSNNNDYLGFGVNAFEHWKITYPNGNFVPGTTNASDIGTGSLEVKNGYIVNPWTVSSDIRTKRFVNSLDVNDMIKLNSLLNPLRYRNVDEWGYQHFGWGAQQVEQSFRDIGYDPDDFALVNKDPLTGKYGLRYEEMIVPLSAIVNNHESRLVALEEQLALAA